MAEILEFTTDTTGNSDTHDPLGINVEAVNACFGHYNKLSYEDRMFARKEILGLAKLADCELNANSRCFIDAYDALPDREKDLVFAAILIAPLNMQIMLGVGVPPGLFGEE